MTTKHLALSLVAGLIFLSITRSSAQTQEFTFLEILLSGDPTYEEQAMERSGVISQVDLNLSLSGIDWQWVSMAGKPYAYEITVSHPQKWLLGYLCVDGQLTKKVSRNRPKFARSFATLESGTYLIQLLLISEDGRRALLSHSLEI